MDFHPRRHPRSRDNGICTQRYLVITHAFTHSASIAAASAAVSARTQIDARVSTSAPPDRPGEPVRMSRSLLILCQRDDSTAAVYILPDFEMMNFRSSGGEGNPCLSIVALRFYCSLFLFFFFLSFCISFADLFIIVLGIVLISFSCNYRWMIIHRVHFFFEMYHRLERDYDDIRELLKCHHVSFSKYLEISRSIK